MVAEIVLLWLTSIEPAREKLLGPVIMNETELRVDPGASCSAIPIEPTSDRGASPASREHPEVSVAAIPSAATKKMQARNRRVDMSVPTAIGAPSHACERDIQASEITANFARAALSRSVEISGFRKVSPIPGDRSGAAARDHISKSPISLIRFDGRKSS